MYTHTDDMYIYIFIDILRTYNVCVYCILYMCLYIVYTANIRHVIYSCMIPLLCRAWCILLAQECKVRF